MTKPATFPPEPRIVCAFSPCRRYRYVWETDVLPEVGKGLCAFVGLNPSTADESGPDPTVRRCMNYAARWGYGRFVMLNLFAFRATDPRVMLAETNPVGEENDSFLFGCGLDADLVVAAWGNHGLHRGRWEEVIMLIPGLHALKITKMGQPSHPLYLKGDLTPARFVPQSRSRAMGPNGSDGAACVGP